MTDSFKIFDFNNSYKNVDLQGAELIKVSNDDIILDEKIKQSEYFKENQPFIGNFHDQTIEMQDFSNQYILTGYRINYNRVILILKSCFMLHNEFVNVWTHFIGIPILIILAIYINQIDSQGISVWPINISLFGSFLCLGTSSFYHLFLAMNIKMAIITLKLDYIGIVFQIYGACFPPYIYGFYCQDFYRILYLSLISIFSLTVLIASLTSKFDEPYFYKVKICLFISLITSCFFPSFHLLYQMSQIQPGNDYIDISFCFLIYCFVGICFLSGFLVYHYKFPERIYPVKFDIWGASHQSWHIFVLIGILLCFYGAITAMQERSGKQCKI